jgi:serine/threonine-protein phosphatase 5
MISGMKPLEVTASDKEKAEEFKAQANKYFQDCLYDEAVQGYTQAISYDPYNPIYYSNRSFANFKLELYGISLDDASKAVELDAKFVKGFYRKASAHMALGSLKGVLY